MKPLFEREEALDRLLKIFDKTEAGRGGACVLVQGEDGIGKTTLVNALKERVGARALVLRGTCTKLNTPRPLGPLFEIADQLGFSVSAMLDAPPSHINKLYQEVRKALSEISTPTPEQIRNLPAVLLIFEDVHWADESTLGLLDFLGNSNRISEMRVMMVITICIDEDPSVDQSRLLCGDLKNAPRIDLPPLTEEGVRRLVLSRGDPAGAAVDVKALYRRTGGRPYFVMSVLSEPAHALPLSFRDGALARLLRQPPAVQQLARIVSLSSSHCAHDLLAEAFGEEYTAGLAGMAHSHVRLLADDGITIGFRHEIDREAIADVVTKLMPTASRQWHRRFVQALESRPNTLLTLLAHHATGSGDPLLVVKWSLPAGLQALRAGSNREVAKLLGEVLEAGHRLPGIDLLDATEHYAQACQNIQDLPKAIEARRSAVEACASRGWTVRRGHNLALLGRVYWLDGDRASAMNAYNDALEVLAPHSDTVEYAWACALVASAYMTAEEDIKAIAFAEQALRIAGTLGALEVRIHALNTLGDAQQYREKDWRSKLEESLRLSLLEPPFVDHAARAYINLASTAVVAQDYDFARRALADGLEFAIDHGLDFQRDYLLAWLARERFESGDRIAASALAGELVLRGRAAPVACIPALTTLAAIAVRCGDDSAPFLLRKAWDKVERTGEHQRIAPILLAQAEAAWCNKEPAACAEYARAGAAAAIEHGSPDNFGRFAVWLQRAGRVDEALQLLTRMPACPPRFRHELRGEWLRAASDWEARGCVYEQAMAMSDVNVEVKPATLLLKTLSATPAILAMRARHGRRGSMAGARESTRKNRFGLTNREDEILRRLEKDPGLSDKAIATALSCGFKTVQNHVLALLKKMEVDGRRQAVDKAKKLRETSHIEDDNGALDQPQLPRTTEQHVSAMLHRLGVINCAEAAAKALLDAIKRKDCRGMVSGPPSHLSYRR